MNQVLFEVENINVRAGSFQLCDVSFSLEAGEYLVVLGPTGCGKTMLLETLAGLRCPARGKVFLRGNDITLTPPEARGFGFAYQDSLLYPFLDVKDNILFGAKAQMRHKEPGILNRVDKLAEAMGIAHLLNRFPRFLSGGEKQRVSLARAILTHPPLLLLDEPLSSLDPQTRRSIQELLQEIHRTEELGTIHVTHDFNEALQLGTHLLVMNQGQVLQQGNPLEVFSKPASLNIANFLMGENLLQGRIEWREERAWFAPPGSDNVMIGPLNECKQPKKEDQDVTLLIRAGNLVLSCVNNHEPCGVNSWNSRIAQISWHSTHVEIICSGQENYRVVMSGAEWKRMNLKKGSPVRLSVDVNDVHLLEE